LAIPAQTQTRHFWRGPAMIRVFAAYRSDTGVGENVSNPPL
jgi:hypothetical protein